MRTSSDPPSPPLPAAPREWLDLHGDALFGYAFRRVRRRDVAEDLVQDTFLAGIKAWDQFAHRSEVKAWLTAILRNKVSDYLRARYKNDRVEHAFPDEDAMFDHRGHWKEPVPAWTGDPSLLVEQAELRAVLKGCIEKLPTRMAHLFVCRATDEAHTSELCDELDISPANAWALLHRARLRLRQCLTINWFADGSKQRAACAKPSNC